MGINCSDGQTINSFRSGQSVHYLCAVLLTFEIAKINQPHLTSVEVRILQSPWVKFRNLTISWKTFDLGSLAFFKCLRPRQLWRRPRRYGRWGPHDCAITFTYFSFFQFIQITKESSPLSEKPLDVSWRRYFPLQTWHSSVTEKSSFRPLINLKSL